VPNGTAGPDSDGALNQAGAVEDAGPVESQATMENFLKDAD
jgi:hypothetical protein